MSRYEYNEEEQKINAVLAYQDKLLNEIGLPDTKGLEETIASSESLLRSLGYNPAHPPSASISPRGTSLLQRRTRTVAPTPRLRTCSLRRSSTTTSRR